MIPDTSLPVTSFAYVRVNTPVAPSPLPWYDLNLDHAGLAPVRCEVDFDRARAEARPVRDLRSAGVEGTDGELVETWGLMIASVMCWPATATNL